MSFSATFNGRPLTTTSASAHKHKPNYFAMMKNVHGSSAAFAQALVKMSKTYK